MTPSNNRVADSNRIIALFMGATLGNGTDKFPEVYNNVPAFYSEKGIGNTVPVETLRYHDRWDWLHPVWRKFAKCSFSDMGQSITHSRFYMKVSEAILADDTPAEAAHLLSQAIVWINQIKK